MNSIVYLLNMCGVNHLTVGGLVQILSISTLAATTGIKHFINLHEEQKKERVIENFNKMETKKKEIQTDLFNEDQYKTNENIKLNYEQIQINKKKIDLDNYNMIEAECEQVEYKGIKVDKFNQLLLGHDSNKQPIWGYDTNYIFCGTTGTGKTRKLHPLLLNYLANKQGIVWIGDLKGIDFKLFRNKKYVMGYTDDLEHVAEIVKAFEQEYINRLELFKKGYTDETGEHKEYLDINDYNSRNTTKLRQFMLLIDEFADIADIYKDRLGRPMGIYADIVRLARKCRAFGGRIVLGVQRPDCSVISGTLKNNCTIVGMKCVNSLNSKIMLDADGCERLQKTEALLINEGHMLKAFAYMVNDIKLITLTSKLN